MREQRSAGLILYREDGDTRKYLLLQHAVEKHWGFVKGQIEHGEKLQGAARRELREEAGITSLEFISGFSEKIDYTFHRDEESFSKEVVYFLGRTEQREVSLSKEHGDFAWLGYEEALERLTYETSKRLLRKAEEFLGSRFE